MEGSYPFVLYSVICLYVQLNVPLKFIWTKLDREDTLSFLHRLFRPIYNKLLLNCVTVQIHSTTSVYSGSYFMYHRLIYYLSG